MSTRISTGHIHSAYSLLWLIPAMRVTLPEAIAMFHSQLVRRPMAREWSGVRTRWGTK